ncbi:zinc finger, CCHC-type containing protein [Tanacetum coccineum]
MAAAAMKRMASNFAKLDKFEEVDFRRWQKKMHFLLSSISVVYVLTTLIPKDGGDDATMEQIRKRAKYNDNKGKRKHHDNTRADPNNKAKPTCWKCGKTGQIKNDCKGVNIGNKANGSGTKGSEDDVAWWIDSVATVHVCKDRCWFNTYESLNDGSILHIENESTALVHGRGCVDLRLNIVNDNIASAFMSTSKLNDSILWHARLGHVYFKRMQDMLKDGLISAFDMDTEKCKTCMLTKITKIPFNVKHETKVLELIHSDLYDLHATSLLGNNKYFVTFIDDASRFCDVYLLHTKDAALDKFIVFKTEVELQQGSQIKRFRTNRGGLSQGFWDEAMLTSCYLLNRVPNKRNMITPYKLWTKRKPNLNYLRVWGCKAVVRLPDPKLKTLGGRGIECIFVGYAKHSKDFRFYVIEPNDSVAINSIIESSDAIFDENRFSSVPRPSQRSLGFRQKSGIDYFDTYASVARISTIRLLIAMASIHIMIIHQMDVETAFLNDELDEEVYMNQPQGFIMPGNKNKWLAAGKEAEWLKNLLLEIPLWSKPIAPISIRCDSAATLIKAYSQMYNGKSRHLGVRHNVIRELITNGVDTQLPAKETWQLSSMWKAERSVG